MSDELFHFDYVIKVSNGNWLINIYEDSISNQVFELAKSVGHWEKENIITPEAIGAITPEIIDSVHAWGWYAFDITGGSSYEGVQPPIYYAFCAFFINLTDSMISKAYIARGVSIIFSTLTLLAYYYLLKKITHSEFIALGSLSVIITLPSWAFQAIRISNDIAAQFLVAATLLVFYQAYEKKIETSTKITIILGILIGLAGLTKLTALIILIPTISACYLVLVKKKSIAIKLKHLIIIYSISAVLCLWFFARNYALYSDFTGTQAIIQAIYLEDLTMPNNIIHAFQHFLNVVFNSAFLPYPNAHNQIIYQIITTIWWIVPAIIIIRIFLDILPQKIFFRFFQNKITYPKKNITLTIMLFTMAISIALASIQFMMTIAIDISERYIMVITGLAVGYFIYGWQTISLSTKIKVITLTIFCLLLALASISHEINLISTYLSRLQN
ncbi:MAG: glycosyltransferase family 39 protein [Candidatus Thermoplasmatota archaeon]|nr:glycosyltransferase family 39 protein [Candidatus Thermoplasmatota archaeon]